LCEYVVLKYRAYFVQPFQMTGMICLSLAGLLGILYLTLAGAPVRYCFVNAGALLIGLALSPIAAYARRWPGAIAIGSALILLGTAFFGTSIDGIARWLGFGGILLQPSFILLPAICVLFAQRRDPATSIGMIIALWALVLQPDDAMVAVLFSGVYMLALLRPGRLTLLVCLICLGGIAIAMINPENPPPARFVEQVLQTAFDVSTLAGIAVWAGSFLLLLPVIIAALRKQPDLDAAIIFGVVWFTSIAAAILDNYPTPVVGYGASPIIGYLIGLAMIELDDKAVPRQPSIRLPELS
jgi:cell division protein FtsW (lipid II flippase)